MKAIVAVVATLMLLAGLYTVMKSSDNATQTGTPNALATKPSDKPLKTVNPKSEAADVVRADYVILEGKRVAGNPLVSAQVGQTIVISISIDATDSLHLHGYDLELALEPGLIAELKFVADKAGRFEFELHGSHLDLGVLEVSPK